MLVNDNNRISPYNEGVLSVKSKYRSKERDHQHHSRQLLCIITIGGALVIIISITVST
jgi:hypothetical protein